MRGRVADGGCILGLAFLYIVSARLGLSLGAVAGFATLVWPPTGISIAGLLLIGNRLWPGILLGAFVANMLAGASVAMALGITVGNTAEALACVHLVRRARGFSVTLENVHSATWMILAVGLGTIVSATIGVASLYGGGVIEGGQVHETWRAWWIGDLVSALVIAPVIMVWSRPPEARFARTLGERVALVATMALVTAATFFGDVSIISDISTPFHQAYALLAVLVWAALRFGQRGSVTILLCVSAAAIAATVLGHGPFIRNGLTQSLLSLQTFLAIVALTFLVFGATIDERRCALAAVRQAYRVAVLANRAKSEFLAITSHELRTPLNAIAGYSQLLEEGVYGALNQKQTEGVASIHRNEQRLLSLIDEVLGVVSAEKGQVALHRELVKVVDAFEAVRPLIAPQLEEHHCVLERSTVEAQLVVRADRQSLQQILMRLLSNASKFSKDGGTVTLGADREGDRVRIWVRDKGVGISQADIEKVFEPFFQTEQATTRRFSGIGLGLTIARNLALRMEGEVTLQSEAGQGTTASVLLPAA